MCCKLTSRQRPRKHSHLFCHRSRVSRLASPPSYRRPCTANTMQPRLDNHSILYPDNYQRAGPERSCQALVLEYRGAAATPHLQALDGPANPCRHIVSQRSATPCRTVTVHDGQEKLASKLPSSCPKQGNLAASGERVCSLSISMSVAKSIQSISSLLRLSSCKRGTRTQARRNVVATQVKP